MTANDTIISRTAAQQVADAWEARAEARRQEGDSAAARLQRIYAGKAEARPDTASAAGAAAVGPVDAWFAVAEPADSAGRLPIEQMLDAPACVISWEPAPPVPLRWETGMEGNPRQISIGDNSGVLAIVSVIFLLMMLSFSRCKRLVGQLWHELWSVRSRDNAFDERTTGETRTMLLMAVQWCVCTGLLIYSAISAFHSDLPPSSALADTGKLIGLCAAYYVFQLAAYSVVGYVFAPPVGRVRYVQGFSASQSLLGFALLLPALVSIFYPAACVVAVWAGAALYLAARIVFIIKGFRIFYVNFGSLLYFILYLCTLEIVPVVIVAGLALRLV